MLYDDTEGSIGVKFAKMDLIGLPWQIIVGKKTVSENIVEIKNRATGKVEEVQIEEAINCFNVKMIRGIGTDIVYIPRILRILQKYGKKNNNKI